MNYCVEFEMWQDTQMILQLLVGLHILDSVGTLYKNETHIVWWRKQM